ncbi:MAG: hypothetical protein EOP35_09865 [Rubrivivax sp.]|nr:MAG: hypothetical protein EOP35_09865 [Rubrivivax sp.]
MSRKQLRRWASAMSAGLREGLGGPALHLAIQAHLPVQVAGHQAASQAAGAGLAGRARPLSGEHA